MHFVQLVSILATATGIAHAHPGHGLSEEIAERRLFLRSVQRPTLAHCAGKLRARGVEANNIARRSSAVEGKRLAKGLQRRSANSDLSTSHNSTDLGFSENTSISDLFASNGSCYLTPEVTQGPYYVGGESLRQNITDSEQGVEITLDYQVINVDTCEPVPGVYVEIWHCNSTGVYSGIVANGNGDSSDQSNLQNKALRGIQATDSDGVAQFNSIVPGHYTGRAPHIHVMVHTNASLYPNETLGNLVYASHVGQAFFDQDLISQVESTAPYKTNYQALTSNSEDSILAQEAGTDGVDPFMNYAYIGNGVGDGLFAWLAFGINTTYSSKVTPAALLYESGGLVSPDASAGRPGGFGGGNGTEPGNSSTSAPSGTQPSVVETPPTNNGLVAKSSFSGLVGLLWLLLVLQ